MALAIMYDIEDEVRDALAGQVEPNLDGNLGEILRQARALNGWSLQKIHERSGISRTQLGELEHDRSKNPGLALLQKVAYGYGLPLLVVIFASMRSNGLTLPPPRQRTRCAKQA